MCQPELSLDAQALNARLTKLEEKIKSGQFVAAPVVKAPAVAAQAVEEEELPPPLDDTDAPPAWDEPAPVVTPVGFWTDLATAIRTELRPPLSGFFAPSPNAPIQGALQGDTVILRCSTKFIMEMVDKPDLIQIVQRKASAQLGRPVQVKAIDLTAAPQKSDKMDALLNFGRAHSDIVKIKE